MCTYFEHNARKAGVDFDKTDVIQITDEELATLQSAQEPEPVMTEIEMDIWLRNFLR